MYNRTVPIHTGYCNWADLRKLKVHKNNKFLLEEGFYSILLYKGVSYRYQADVDKPQLGGT